jgi:hypothetical protein
MLDLFHSRPALFVCIENNLVSILIAFREILFLFTVHQQYRKQLYNRRNVHHYCEQLQEPKPLYYTRLTIISGLQILVIDLRS